MKAKLIKMKYPALSFEFDYAAFADLYSFARNFSFQFDSP